MRLILIDRKITVVAVLIFIFCLVFASSAEIMNYTYDSNNRLVCAKRGGAATIVYSYEKVGNLLSRTLTSGGNTSVIPSSFDFGVVYVGIKSTASSFTLTNFCLDSLVICTITLTGLNPSEFIIQNDTCSGQTIRRLSSCTVQAAMAPTLAGPKSANLSIPSNDPDRPILGDYTRRKI